MKTAHVVVAILILILGLGVWSVSGSDGVSVSSSVGSNSRVGDILPWQYTPGFPDQRVDTGDTGTVVLVSINIGLQSNNTCITCNSRPNLVAPGASFSCLTNKPVLWWGDGNTICDHKAPIYARGTYIVLI